MENPKPAPATEPLMTDDERHQQALLGQKIYEETHPRDELLAELKQMQGDGPPPY